MDEMERMTHDEMQRFIDLEMSEGKSWVEALEKLAFILDLRPLNQKPSN